MFQDRFWFVHRWIMWVKGLGHGRGFGIQSPWAYHFVRYVVNEKYPYYAYFRLAQLYPHLTVRVRRLAEFFFRISNYVGAKRWGVCSEDFNIVSAYVKGGCSGAEVVRCVSDSDMDWVGQLDILVTSADACYHELRHAFALHAGSSSIMIVRRNHASYSAWQTWKKMLADDVCGVSFDLYYCGIVFFDKKKYPHRYILNY